MANQKWRLILAAGVMAAALSMGGPAHAQEDNTPDGVKEMAQEDTWGIQGHYQGDTNPARFAEKLVAQAAKDPKSCAELNLMFDNVEVVQSEADFGGGNGTRLCILSYLEGGARMVALLNQRNIDEWRAAKSHYLPALAAGGVDLCSITSWISFNAAITKAQTYNDRQSQERPCDPVFIVHGPESEARLEEVKAAFARSTARAGELFGWQPSFAVNVHLYDTHIDFVKGVWIDGGDDTATPRSLADVGGVSLILAHGESGFLLDLSAYPESSGLEMLVAHEFAHIVQNSILGCACTAPFWAIEGGAEYFASRVVGVDQPNLTERFRAAVNDQYAKSPPALKKINARPRDSKLELAAYSRGYAAFRFLAEQHGDDAFSRLHRDRPTGSIDRYLAGLTQITGQTLDDFDAGLAGWLREAAGSLPVRTNPATTIIAANSNVSYLATARIVGRNTFVETGGYSARDGGVVIASEWRCTSKGVKGEAKLYTPSNQLFARIRFTVQPGCSELVLIGLSLDSSAGGRTARSQTGVWRIEVTGDNALQATTSFRLD